jgi:hypothetical protein
MKNFTFSGYDVSNLQIGELELTSAELAKELDISVAEVEAMTEEEVEELRGKMYFVINDEERLFELAAARSEAERAAVLARASAVGALLDAGHSVEEALAMT